MRRIELEGLFEEETGRVVLQVAGHAAVDLLARGYGSATVLSVLGVAEKGVFVWGLFCLGSVIERLFYLLRFKTKKIEWILEAYRTLS